MVKRSLIALALFLSLLAGALVTAQPASAASCSWTVVLNNSHGRLEVFACLSHVYASGGTLPGERSAAAYDCFKSGTYDRQPCNVAATQDLWFNATRVRSDDVHGCCGANPYSLYGTPAPCTSAWIKAVVKDIHVRFSDQTLWPRDGDPPLPAVSSPLFAGGSITPCLA